MKFKFTVLETRVVNCEYIVKADDMAEARQKAESGETLSEDDDGSCIVTDRYVQAELGEVPDASGDDSDSQQRNS